MRFLNDWVSENLLKALGWTLVHSVWQLILIAAILWILLKLTPKAKPSINYGLALGALALVVVVATLTFIYQVQQTEGTKAYLTAADNFQMVLDNSQALSAESKVDSVIQNGTFWIEQNMFMLVNFWFLGALLFLFRLFNSLSEIRSLRKSASPIVDFQIQKIAFTLAEKMGIKGEIQLKISSIGQSPLTFGALKPIILLPAGLIFQLSPLQLEAIIAHELAHVKRNDYLVNLLFSTLEVVFFFHPCYWWITNTVKELRENAADDLVLKAGIEPKNLATGLAEVINFAKQNPPELALAAGKRRNPTLQRIKRMLGYPAQNYPQNPIISIPMVLTLFLSVGLMASAQQDAPKASYPIAPKAKTETIESAFPALSVADTTIKNPTDPRSFEMSSMLQKNSMVFTDENGNTFRVEGDLLISGTDTLVLSPKLKASIDKLKVFDFESMPVLELPEAPEFPMDVEMAPIPSYDFGANMPTLALIPPMPPMDMTSFPIPDMDFEMPDFPPMDMDFQFDENFSPMFFDIDTTKMSKAEKQEWAKEMEVKAKEWAEKAEIASKEWEKKSEEWAAKFEKEFQPKLKEFEIKMKQWEEANGPRVKEFEDKIAEWQAAHGPIMEEFEAKMQEWEAANGPKMKEFEMKMKDWELANEPKMKEFEQRMKEWEARQKPKMEEFQRKMEVWQKEHEAKLQEVQKLIQEELKKENKY